MFCYGMNQFQKIDISALYCSEVWSNTNPMMLGGSKYHYSFYVFPAITLINDDN